MQDNTGRPESGACAPGTVPCDAAEGTDALTVLYDGACPLCAKEISHYQGLTPLCPVQWVDVSQLPDGDVTPGLSRDQALARMHVIAPDGSVISGARAFVAMWERLPRWRWLARLASVPPLPAVLEWLYRGFLRHRPAIQSWVRKDQQGWLLRELRSDHAGETGAVCIYRGILAVSRDPDVREFARRHLETELEHLAAMETLVPPAKRTRLLPVWRLAGWLTGSLPAAVGPAAVYGTIAAVESFVDRHYLQQIERLQPEDPLRARLAAFREDELHHRDEAQALAPGPQGLLLRAWTTLVGIGSASAVVIARRL
jgi:demethoxyubiquinone hydroxylase (CLK1/Coq7/Cat5 family)